MGSFLNSLIISRSLENDEKMIYCCHTRTSCRNTRHCCCFSRTYSGRILCCHIIENTFKGMSFIVHWCLHSLTIVIMVLAYLMLWFIMEERCCCHYEDIPIIMKDKLAFGKTCLYFHGSKLSFFFGGHEISWLQGFYPHKKSINF